MSNVSVNDVNDLIWLKRRLSHVNEEQVEYFLERVSVLCDNGMDEKSARSAGLVLLCDHMRL
jgi:hypothetical protein